MPSLNSEIRYVFEVVNSLTGMPVGGLNIGNFTASLTRRSGSFMVPSSELVGVAETSTAGTYFVYYVPVAAATLYRLKLTPVSTSHVADPDEWQDDVAAVAVSTVGPYLTTRAAFKAAFGAAFAGTENDARIDALLPQVTTLFESYCDRQFFSSVVTEYPRLRSKQPVSIFLRKPPITAVTSLHLSTSIPRVYDASTLLTEGTDFIVSGDRLWIDFLAPRTLGPESVERVLQVVYTGGFAAVPGDLERAAQEVISRKVMKAKNDLYHFLGSTQSDGSMQGITFEDIPPTALMVLDLYRLGVFA